MYARVAPEQQQHYFTRQLSPVLPDARGVRNTPRARAARIVSMKGVSPRRVTCVTCFCSGFLDASLEAGIVNRNTLYFVSSSLEIQSLIFKNKYSSGSNVVCTYIHENSFHV